MVAKEPVKIGRPWLKELLEKNSVLGLSLSTVLVIVIVMLSAVGIFGSSIVVQRAVEHASYTTVDAQLQQEVDDWERRLSTRVSYGPAAALVFPSDMYFGWFEKNGSNGTEFTGNYANSKPDFNKFYVNEGIFNVDSAPGSDRDVKWRATAEQKGDLLVVVAKDVTRERAIMKRLIFGQMTIGLAVLMLIALASSYIIRQTLRPLRTVEETANAIAHGDLERRVPEDWPAETEVGSLARSVNSMLEQIQDNISSLKNKEEEMRRFVGDASHELRTPLTSVKGYAELYRSGITSDADMVINKIEAEASRMSLLVEDLLALTRAEGKTAEKAPVDLLELVTNVASSLQGAFPSRKLSIIPDTVNLPMALGNAPKLHQVFTNLIVNALKHGGEDAKVTVRITEETLDLKPEKFIVEVIDDGVGMSEKDAQNIFERFYRADTSRTRATGGSGLGLAIVKSLVEAHDGIVTVDTALGRGTTFRVELPAAKS